jgi:4-aminobutyrate--pyruvate transaminase
MIWYYNNARGLHEKKKLIGRIKGYHGVTIASASLTGLPYNHKSFDLPLPGFLHTMTPHFYHGALPGETEAEFATRCADELEKLILAEGPETIAAFFAEPIMGAGGVIIPPKGYFPKIQAVLNKYDILLVADEVICGFGRTGNYWGSQTMGVTPDILTCAKALSAAYLPISAVLVNAKVYDVISDETHKIGTFGHGYTYSGHPVSAAVAVETLKIYDELNILDHIAEVGPHLQSELRRRFTDHPLVGEVRGTGLIAALELVEDKAAHRNFDASRRVAARTAKHLEGFGVIGRPLPGDGLAFSPPLIITKSEIDEVLDGVEKALAAITVDLRAEGFQASA